MVSTSITPFLGVYLAGAFPSPKEEKEKEEEEEEEEEEGRR